MKILRLIRDQWERASLYDTIVGAERKKGPSSLNVMVKVLHAEHK